MSSVREHKLPELSFDDVLKKKGTNLEGTVKMKTNHASALILHCMANKSLTLVYNFVFVFWYCWSILHVAMLMYISLL